MSKNHDLNCGGYDGNWSSNEILRGRAGYNAAEFYTDGRAENKSPWHELTKRTRENYIRSVAAAAKEGECGSVENAVLCARHDVVRAYIEEAHSSIDGNTNKDSAEILINRWCSRAEGKLKYDFRQIRLAYDVNEKGCPDLTGEQLDGIAKRIKDRNYRGYTADDVKAWGVKSPEEYTPEEYNKAMVQDARDPREGFHFDVNHPGKRGPNGLAAKTEEEVMTEREKSAFERVYGGMPYSRGCDSPWVKTSPEIVRDRWDRIRDIFYEAEQAHAVQRSQEGKKFGEILAKWKVEWDTLNPR